MTSTSTSPEVTSYCAQVAEVEVDTETGQLRVNRIVTAHDVGIILNPMTHQGQIEDGVVQGLGYALMEEMKTESRAGLYTEPWRVQDTHHDGYSTTDDGAVGAYFRPGALQQQGHWREQQHPRGGGHCQCCR